MVFTDPVRGFSGECQATPQDEHQLGDFILEEKIAV